MADVEEPKFNTLADRIAALNKQKNFSTPPPSTKRAPPPPPPGNPANGNNSIADNGAVTSDTPNLPSRPQKKSPPILPKRTSTAESAVESPPLPGRSAPPPLPGRRDSAQPTPSLPPRRPSTQQLGRRGSNSSDVSHISAISNLSLSHAPSRTSTSSFEAPPSARRVLAPTLDQTKLPPLPPSRKERDAQAAREAAGKERTEIVKAPLLPTRSSPAVQQTGFAERPALPSRPTGSLNQTQADENPAATPRRLPPPPSSFVRSQTAFEGSQRPPPIPSSRPAGRGTDSASPPPIPVAFRPTSDQIDAVVVRTTTTPATTSQEVSCLVCRDFTAPDHVASQYPSHSLPRHDPVGYLANVLCGPFPSDTDKARAIFTWCHHNIAYNVEEFFGKCIKGRNVDETIFHGKAVCQGYAEVYRAIAQRAGLECVLIGGHGKGYGHRPLKAGEAPPPRNPTGHAWNAVRIDHGEWKLIDACWGAGSVGDQKYTKHFKPEMFCLSNERFGLKHFPGDERYFFRGDGSPIPTWEEYMVGPTRGAEAAQWMSTGTEEGLSEFTFSPAEKHIPVRDGDATVRFQFSKICEHWDGERNGPGRPYLLQLKVCGRGGGYADDLLLLETNGFWWWVDVPARELGRPGEQVQLYALTKLGGRDARGVSREEYLRVKSHSAMGWSVYAVWDLV
ncbi:hypothetical protein GGR56DRAFT_226636 [Xylariaceae sp. FL0804]|nr:hypothetical protein GGR56DRAFT_226636 [Xylariaceae sp. FL0804]